jgi:hypothetical protein
LTVTFAVRSAVLIPFCAVLAVPLTVLDAVFTVLSVPRAACLMVLLGFCAVLMALPVAYCVRKAVCLALSCARFTVSALGGFAKGLMAFLNRRGAKQHNDGSQS